MLLLPDCVRIDPSPIDCDRYLREPKSKWFYQPGFTKIGHFKNCKEQILNGAVRVYHGCVLLSVLARGAFRAPNHSPGVPTFRT